MVLREYEVNHKVFSPRENERQVNDTNKLIKTFWESRKRADYRSEFDTSGLPTKLRPVVDSVHKLVLRANPSGSSLMLLDGTRRVIKKAIREGTFKKSFWREEHLDPVELKEKNFIADEVDLKKVQGAFSRKLKKEELEVVLGSLTKLRNSLGQIRKEQLRRMKKTAKDFGIPEDSLPEHFPLLFSVRVGPSHKGVDPYNYTPHPFESKGDGRLNFLFDRMLETNLLLNDPLSSKRFSRAKSKWRRPLAAFSGFSVFPLNEGTTKKEKIMMVDVLQKGSHPLKGENWMMKLPQIPDLKGWDKLLFLHHLELAKHLGVKKVFLVDAEHARKTADTLLPENNLKKKSLRHYDDIGKSFKGKHVKVTFIGHEGEGFATGYEWEIKSYS